MWFGDQEDWLLLLSSEEKKKSKTLLQNYKDIGYSVEEPLSFSPTARLGKPKKKATT